MSSEAIVILVMVGIAALGLFYLEMHSRRNKRREQEQPESVDKD